MAQRIFYAAGPGNVIRAHKHWEQGQLDPSQMSRTYSGQFADFCKSIAADALIVSYCPAPDAYRSGKFIIEHDPKPFANARGALYHVSEILYGLQLLVKALRFRADVAVIHSGTTHEFVLLLFTLAGIDVVPVLHNTPWPSGFKPKRLVRKLISRLDAVLFRRGARAVIGVSPECLRQVRELTNGLRQDGLIEMRGQYIADYFATIAPPMAERPPFEVLYCGRVTHDKGVYDLLQIARRVEDLRPGLVRWTVCGDGPELAGLRRQHASMGLKDIVDIRGFTAPAELKAVLEHSHAAIVPTRGEFAEGMALSAVEAILAGRPCVTSPVVPALEVLRPACVEARTNDVESYVAAIIELATSERLYRRLCAACPGLAAPFYEIATGFAAALHRAIATTTPAASTMPEAVASHREG
ncbi:MAG: glycosyltransferase family 4 protein [Xanthobacteraceae bacterium]|nr:glycosyltransferase family 4 protein [Xanthobacteraceae bacterium]